MTTPRFTKKDLDVLLTAVNCYQEELFVRDNEEDEDFTAEIEALERVRSKIQRRRYAYRLRLK